MTFRSVGVVFFIECIATQQLCFIRFHLLDSVHFLDFSNYSLNIPRIHLLFSTFFFLKWHIKFFKIYAFFSCFFLHNLLVNHDFTKFSHDILRNSDWNVFFSFSECLIDNFSNDLIRLHVLLYFSLRNHFGVIVVYTWKIRKFINDLPRI